ncbi:GntR family transcriptional regulator [Salinicoccus carnicancri]|uniref:GntR family transcriptional regulator n=1 Tax=Salinicoccus carnicancri TaxID=558170 RepID=UPI0003019A98|nr:GntR family transcriptional regulator [Salinicoccus carnicancri]
MDKNQSLHACIKDDLLNQIKSGDFQKGEKIPTELELCQTYEVSRTTVRSALHQLTLEGHLVRKQGKGTFVAEKKVNQTLSPTMDSFNEQVTTQGKKPDISLIDIKVIPAEERLAQSLTVSPNDPIQRIERKRYVNEEPTQYEISYIPWTIAPGVTKNHAETSLFEALAEEFNVSIHKTTEHIEITLADEQVSSILQCEPGHPCFYIETITEDKEGRKVEFSRSYFRGDKTNFTIERNYD